MKVIKRPVYASSKKADPHSILMPSNDELLKTYIQDMRKFTADPTVASLRDAAGTSGLMTRYASTSSS